MGYTIFVIEYLSLIDYSTVKLIGFDHSYHDRYYIKVFAATLYQESFLVAWGGW